MFVALLRPYENPPINDVHIVDHETKGIKAFENDWEKCLSAEKKAHPDEWQVTDVIRRMEKKHWRFMLAAYTAVAY